VDRIEITRELNDGLKALSLIRNGPPDEIERFLDKNQRTSDLFRVKEDILFATGTDNLTILIEPTERLLELVSALRTHKRK